MKYSFVTMRMVYQIVEKFVYEETFGIIHRNYLFERK